LRVVRRMTSRDHLEEVRRQILDRDKRSWAITEYGGDPDVFRTECVTPLQILQQQGCFEIREIYTYARGRKYVSRIDIISAVNLDL